MAHDRQRARLRAVGRLVICLVLSGVWGIDAAQAQTTRARGDYDKAIPSAPPPAQAPSQATTQVPTQAQAPSPAAAPQPREQPPRRPAPSLAQRSEGEPGPPPVIIWQPSEASPQRPAASTRATSRQPGATSASPPARPQPDASEGPRAAAEGFYRTYLQLRPMPGLPNATQRLRLRPHVTAALDAALAAGVKADQESQRQGSALHEGDVLTSLGEGATNASVSDCQADGPRFACVVRLTAGQGVEWEDRVLLARTPAGWAVDDVTYGGRFAAGNFGALRELLTILVRQVSPRPAPPNAGQPPQQPAQ